MSAPVRCDPHTRHFIGPNGLRRIDRLNGDAGSQGAQPTTGATAPSRKPLHRVPEPDFHVVVVPELDGGRLTGHDRDVLGLARALADSGGAAGAVVAVVFGECRESGFDEAGADRLLHLDDEAYSGYSPEPRLAALLAAEAALSPRHWLFPDAGGISDELGRRLAARLGERPATGAWRVDPQYTVCRADGGRSDVTRPTPRLILAAAECAEPVEASRHEAAALVLDEQPRRRPRAVVDEGEQEADPATVPLAEAEFILSAGNGVRDWALFHRTAEMLGAAEGASRVAVDDGHMPRTRQVGATGTLVSARVYIAVGISGAIQHLQGIGRCGKVIAINQDPDCDMVRRADLSVIGDSSEVLRALVDQVAPGGEVDTHAA